MISFCLLGSISNIALANDTEHNTITTTDVAEKVPTVTVTVDALTNLTTAIEYSYSAMVETTQESTISAETSGIVNNIAIEVGSRVSKGDLLLSLDCEGLTYDKSINEAQKAAQWASVKLAKKQVSRFTKLKTKGAATQAQIDEFSASAESGVAQLGVFDANIRKLDFMLTKCKIYAPFNGVVTQKSISLGEFASPGIALLTLTNIDSNEVIANLRADLIKDLEENIDTAKFFFNDQLVGVKLKTIIPSINSLANTQEIRFVTDNSKKLVNKANGKLIWTAGLSLPSRFLTTRDEKLGVYLYNPDNAKSPLTFFPIPDASQGRSIRVDHILSADTQIATAGIAKVNDKTLPYINIVFAN